MKILLLKFRNIGDVLLCTPLVSNLRHHYPNAQIEFCVNKETEAMLTLNPNINRIITYDRIAIKSLTTGNATSASSKAKRISFKPESTCSSFNEGALLSLEKIFSNLFVKFSNIFKHPTPIALVGEPSLTSVDTLV